MNARNPLGILTLALLQSACGGGGSSTGTTGPTAATATISGTVPGTRIEAYGDNGSYYTVDSHHNGTTQHPFELKVRAGIGYHLVMITGEGTSDEVVSPIGYRDSSGRIRTRIRMGSDDHIDLGFVPLPMGRNAAAGDDRDGDGTLDHPLVLDDVGSNNPLAQCDADRDGIDDWDDPDHGGYHYSDRTRDPQDHDDDGIPNRYDPDHVARNDDSDRDGLPDPIDANRYNDPHHANDDLRDDCNHDGYIDDDHDHDGYHDDDDDRDGYHDDDLNHDGYHDSDDRHDDHRQGGSCRS